MISSTGSLGCHTLTAAAAFCNTVLKSLVVFRNYSRSQFQQFWGFAFYIYISKIATLSQAWFTFSLWSEVSSIHVVQVILALHPPLPLLGLSEFQVQTKTHTHTHTVFYWKFEALFEFLFSLKRLSLWHFAWDTCLWKVNRCLGDCPAPGEACLLWKGCPVTQPSGLYFQLIVVVGPETG